MQLSPHFSLAELTVTTRRIDNAPDANAIVWLKLLALKLEEVRELLGGTALYIDSGYRSLAVNTAVGGVPDSAHLYGKAGDLRHGIYSPLEVCQRIVKSPIKFDQLIHEFTWTHLAISDTNSRRSILTAERVHDRTSYRVGL